MYQLSQQQKVEVWEAIKWRPRKRSKKIMSVVLSACCTWGSSGDLLGKRNTQCSGLNPKILLTLSCRGAWDSVVFRWFCSTVRTKNHWLMGFRDSVFLHMALVSSSKKVSHSYLSRLLQVYLAEYVLHTRQQGLRITLLSTYIIVTNTKEPYLWGCLICFNSLF